MRHSTIPVLALFLILAACGGQPTGEQPETVASNEAVPDDDIHRTAAEMPSDDVLSTAMSGAMGGSMGGLNTEVGVPPEIADAWSGVRVRLVDIESGDAQLVEVQLGETVSLGSSGLTLTAHTFIPDFVMDEGGITSRSADANNPAANVVITEEGAEDYEGWLFAAMPGIHPFPHEQYQVLLVEGLPAE